MQLLFLFYKTGFLRRRTQIENTSQGIKTCKYKTEKKDSAILTRWAWNNMPLHKTFQMGKEWYGWDNQLNFEYNLKKILIVSLFNLLSPLHKFQWSEDVMFVKIQWAISRRTWSNTGLFVLILMHFTCWFQIWVQY